MSTRHELVIRHFAHARALAHRSDGAVSLTATVDTLRGRSAKVHSRLARLQIAFRREREGGAL